MKSTDKDPDPVQAIFCPYRLDGLGYLPLTQKTRARIPVGTPNNGSELPDNG